MKDKVKTCSNCYLREGQKCIVKNCKIKAYEENCIYWTANSKKTDIIETIYIIFLLLFITSPVWLMMLFIIWVWVY